MNHLDKLLEVMNQLRDPSSGCPWDLEQDFASIAPHTIEEAYEVADAIANGDMGELRDELGDLLFQVVFHYIQCPVNQFKHFKKPISLMLVKPYFTFYFTFHSFRHLIKNISNFLLEIT